MNMKRLGWLVAVVLVSVVVWASPALAGPAKVYVADEEGDTVTVLDATSFARLVTIPVGREPHNVQVSPDGGWAWVTINSEVEAKGKGEGWYWYLLVDLKGDRNHHRRCTSDNNRLRESLLWQARGLF